MTVLDELTLYDPDQTALMALLAGEPRFRLKQLWDGLYREGRRPEEMTNLPASLRASLAEALPEALTEASVAEADRGTTVKTAWRLRDGHIVESVLMHYPGRSTVCVSSQAGCAMACGFCATGQAGFARHLSTGEIVEQVIRARRQAQPRRVDNVVLMGMGEPLANYDRVLAALRRLHVDIGISARHLTVSTVGVVPGIRRLATEPEPFNLAISLHGANDELRNELVPLNRRYPLAELMSAARDYLEAKGRRLSFEWALIAEVNDRDRDARELAALALPLGAHVNIIPLNPTPGFATLGTSLMRVASFRNELVARGVNATVRKNRGTEIDAACGQLAAAAARLNNASGGSSQPVTLGRPT